MMHFLCTCTGWSKGGKWRGLHWSRAEHAGNDAIAKAFQTKTGAAVYRWDDGDFEACAPPAAAPKARGFVRGLLSQNAWLRKSAGDFGEGQARRISRS
jgi:hypothetical protein